MNICIGTLPITPKIETGFEFYFTPIVTRVLSKLVGLPMVLAINMVGRKSDYSAFRSFLDGVIKLEIMPERIWFDNNPDHLEKISSYLEILDSKGVLEETCAEVMMCQCGAIETLSVDFGRKKDFKLLEFIGGNWSCRLCGSSLESKKTKVLMVHLPVIANTPITYPGKFSRELREKLDTLSLRPWLITRHREINPPAVFKGHKYFMDVDFAWATFLTTLSQEGWLMEAIVVSHRVLNQLAGLYAINSVLMGNHYPIKEVIVTPFCQSGISNDVVKGYSAKAIKAFVLEMFQSNRKEVAINSRELFLAELSLKLAGEISTDHAIVIDTLAEALALIKDEGMVKLMKLVRQQKQLSRQELAILQALTE